MRQPRSSTAGTPTLLQACCLPDHEQEDWQAIGPRLLSPGRGLWLHRPQSFRPSAEVEGGKSSQCRARSPLNCLLVRLTAPPPGRVVAADWSETLRLPAGDSVRLEYSKNERLAFLADQFGQPFS